MNTAHRRRLWALLLREWITLRSWSLTLLLLSIAGPGINLLNAATSFNHNGTRITSVFESIYTTTLWGSVEVSKNHLVSMGTTPPAALTVQGFPPASLWVIAVSLTLGTLMATLDRHTLNVRDIFAAPVHRREWVQAKFLYGVLAMTFLLVIRTAVISLSNAISPWHFSSRLILLAGVTNFSIGIACFAIAFVLGQLVGNVFVAWGLGFLGTVFPLTLGVIVRFFSSVQHPSGAIITLGHFFLRLSPLWYTDYTTHTTQAFLPAGTNDAHPKSIAVTVTTSVHGPLLLVAAAVVLLILAYLLSAKVFQHVKSEHMSNFVIAPSALHFSLSLISMVAGAVLAQIIGRWTLGVFIATAVVCYAALWIGYQKTRGGESLHWRKRKERTQFSEVR